MLRTSPIVAGFVINVLTITAQQSPGEPLSSRSYNEYHLWSNVIYTITANPGFYIVDVQVDPSQSVPLLIFPQQTILLIT
jgi:hypothetical protein